MGPTALGPAASQGRAGASEPGLLTNSVSLTITAPPSGTAPRMQEFLIHIDLKSEIV